MHSSDECATWRVVYTHGHALLDMEFAANVQAVLAINRLGPSTLARARGSSFYNACCAHHKAPAHGVLLSTQNPVGQHAQRAHQPTGTHSEPGYTTRQIRTIHTVTHTQNISPVHVLIGSTLQTPLQTPRRPPMRLPPTSSTAQPPRLSLIHI